jgi:hypothetical protein
MIKGILVAMLLTCGVQGSPFRAVFKNDADVTALGPLSRPQIAAVLQAVERAGAKAVVVKFFLDEPRDPAGDATLAKALQACGVPVILQANVNGDTPKPNLLPVALRRANLPKISGLISGMKGWLPLPEFAEPAHGIGFIDQLNPMPILERYQGETVPSLFLLALEQAHGTSHCTATEVAFGALKLVMKNGAVPVAYPTRDDMAPISFADALSGKAANEFCGQIVVIGVDDKSMHTFPTPIGPVKAHRLFMYSLDAAHAALVKQQTK